MTLADRQLSLLVDHAGLLRAAFRHARDRKSFAVDAIVILPDHLHTILTLPSGDSDFSGRWKTIKAAFTRSMWQRARPFSATAVANICFGSGASGSTIRNDPDFERCANYVHFNPVKHGLVSTPAEWPFSSLPRYIRAGMLPHDWAGTIVRTMPNLVNR